MNWKYYNKAAKFSKKLLRIRIPSKLFRRELYHYMTWNEWGYIHTIFQIRPYLTLKGILVVVHTSRPGLFIGVGGKFIDGAEAHLQKFFQIIKVKCTVEECTVFQNIHR